MSQAQSPNLLQSINGSKMTENVLPNNHNIGRLYISRSPVNPPLTSFPNTLPTASSLIEKCSL